jgi:hypothetical protein
MMARYYGIPTSDLQGDSKRDTPIRPSSCGMVCGRRHFLASGAMSIGGLAVAWPFNQDRLRAAPVKPDLDRRSHDLKPKTPPHPARAKAMISLFIEGGPSHIDLFDASRGRGRPQSTAASGSRTSARRGTVRRFP